jgi:hypothetical protein
MQSASIAKSSSSLPLAEASTVMSDSNDEEEVLEGGIA